VTTLAPYPSDIVLVPRRPRRYRAVIALLAAAAVVLLVLNVRSAPKPTPRPRPSPVAHVARPAAPRLSASIAGKTYACTVVPPKPAKH
jgi:hypothetical protein